METAKLALNNDQVRSNIANILSKFRWQILLQILYIGKWSKRMKKMKKTMPIFS